MSLSLPMLDFYTCVKMKPNKQFLTTQSFKAVDNFEGP